MARKVVIYTPDEEYFIEMNKVILTPRMDAVVVENGRRIKAKAQIAIDMNKARLIVITADNRKFTEKDFDEIEFV